MVKEVSELYIQGCKDMGHKKHIVPVLAQADGSQYRFSKVLQSIEKSHARLPYLA